MNVLGEVRFFPTPQEIIEGGLLHRMSRSGIRLYLFLLYLGQKHSAVRIETVGYEIHDFTGMHENRVVEARRQLIRLGLVSCRALEHNIYEYRLLDPRTREQLAPPTGKDGKPRKGLRRWHPVPGRSARTSKSNRAQKMKRSSEAMAHPPSWDDINAGHEREPGEDRIH